MWEASAGIIAALVISVIIGLVGIFVRPAARPSRPGSTRDTTIDGGTNINTARQVDVAAGIGSPVSRGTDGNNDVDRKKWEAAATARTS